MTALESVRRHRREILEMARRHGAANVRIFGSTVRGDDRPDSDIDLLVDTTEAVSSWFPAGLMLDLQELLGRPIDVVTERGLNPFVRDAVLREAQPI